MACPECARLRREMELASSEYRELLEAVSGATQEEIAEAFRQAARSPTSVKNYLALRQFYAHTRVCEDPDSKRQLQLESLHSMYSAGDADTKQEFMDKMKALLRAEKAV